MSKPESMIVHNVFFALHESTPPARKKLVEACTKHLAGHPGEVSFHVGILCDALARPVNDRDYDVGLHIVFRTLADHDAYQEHPRHVQFVDENKPHWRKVRVFDSAVGS